MTTPRSRRANRRELLVRSATPGPLLLLIVALLIPSVSLAGDEVVPAGYNVISACSWSDTTLAPDDTLIITRSVRNAESFPVTGLYFVENLPPEFHLLSHTVTVNGSAVSYGFSGAMRDFVIPGYDTYEWIVDEPGSTGGIQRPIQPGDSVALELALTCTDLGSFEFPLHASSFYGNGTAFFSAGDPVTVHVDPSNSSLCSGVCGDVDGSGSLSATDVTLLYNAIAWVDPPVVDDACANVDDCLGLSLRDAAYLNETIRSGWPLLDCNPDQSAIGPAPSADYTLVYDQLLSPGESVTSVQVDLITSQPLLALSLTLTVDVGGITPVFEQLSTPPIGPAPALVRRSLVDLGSVAGAHGSLAGTWLFPGDGVLPPGRHQLAVFNITVSPSAQPRAIQIELLDSPDPIDHPSMAIAPDLAGWTVGLDPYIALTTGDTNDDGAITSSDLVTVVNHVFKGGPPPLPLAATGDTNCSGAITSVDILLLVNYVFKGGPAPCDISSTCSVSLDGWICP